MPQKLVNSEDMRNSYTILQSPKVQVLALGYSPSEGAEITLCMSRVLQFPPTHNIPCDALGKETMVTNSQSVVGQDSCRSRITHID